jgi:hypothetical protein
MVHTERVFKFAEDVTSVARLAESLTQRTWTLCTAFRLMTAPGAEPLLFLNDSFSEDGAQEYAVVRNGRQIESITFSWCSRAEAHNYIAWLVGGGGGDYGAVEVRLEPADRHRYPLCR